MKYSICYDIKTREIQWALECFDCYLIQSTVDVASKYDSAGSKYIIPFKEDNY
tara:strand:- start:1731 stop:1889 length:159 start_codon:yes stop_codon:yes gene_type:complete